MLTENTPSHAAVVEKKDGSTGTRTPTPRIESVHQGTARQMMAVSFLDREGLMYKAVQGIVPGLGPRHDGRGIPHKTQHNNMK
jgi:hypothetical protein